MNAACPHCGKLNDDHWNSSGQRSHPIPGDVSLCVYCGKLGIFTQDGIRKPTEDETRNLYQEPAVQRALALASSLPHRRSHRHGEEP